jgi:hypothetical protein
MCVGLPLVLMLTIFQRSKAKTFCLVSFLARKKKCGLPSPKRLFFVSARKLAKQNFLL